MVYRQRRAKGLLALLGVVLLVSLGFSAIIEVPYTIKSFSEVFPKEKWLLTRGKSGEIVSNLIDFSLGHTAQYNISQFERGEFVSVDFSNYLNGKKEFSKGDTVVFIRSSNVQDQLIKTEGELEVALANLKSQRSAQKEPMIREAESRLKYTEEKLAEQKVLLDRAKQLYEKNLSSKQEFEQQKWTLDLLEIEAKVYKAQLENLRTGVKPEEVGFLESQIRSVKSRLSFLKNRENQLLLQSPISGTIIPSFSPDTLLNIANIKTVILHIPVKIEDIKEFKEGAKLPITFANMTNTYLGQVIAISKEVKMLVGHQVVFVSIQLDNLSVELLPGMILDCSIMIRKANLFDNLTRMVDY
ncbi:MAG: HlyD family secretion protein [Clostridiales bacterium]